MYECFILGHTSLPCPVSLSWLGKAMKWYSSLFRSPELKLHHYTQNTIFFYVCGGGGGGGGVLTSVQGIWSLYSKLHQQGECVFGEGDVCVCVCVSIISFYLFFVAIPYKGVA